MSVMAAAVTYGQRVRIGTEGYCRGLRVGAPDGNDAVAADIGVDFRWVQGLQVTHYGIVGELLATSSLRMVVQLMPNLFVINHSFIICSRKKSPRTSKFLKAS